MDTLAGLPECVEKEFSESIIARDEAVAVLATAPGLGPPDLCWLQKGQGAWSPGTPPGRGYYHSVLGGDVSSSAAIAGYFATLTARVEKPGLLAGLWRGAELSVQRGFYCTYDAISRTDLRCELCVPGGVVCGMVDAAGNLHDASTPQLWRQAQVSAFVRAQLYEPEMTLNGGALDTLDPLPTPAAERALLAAVEALYAARVLPAGLEPVSVSQGYGTVPEQSDLAAFAVWHHFRRRQRWTAARTFFARLGAHCPAAAVWEAAALRAAGREEGVCELLRSALERSPSSPALLSALAVEYMRVQQIEAAAKLARRAVQLQPRCRPAWLIIARCYAAEGRYAEALVSLNAVPTPPLPRDERELLLVVPPLEPERVTAPQVLAYHPDLEAARALALEESDNTGGSQLLAYLPGAVLLNHEPADAGPWPDASPNRVTRAVLGAVYRQLQDVVSALGWDGFLAVRSSVFVMHDTARTPTARQTAAAAAGPAQAQAPGTGAAEGATAAASAPTPAPAGAAGPGQQPARPSDSQGEPELDRTQQARQPLSSAAAGPPGVPVRRSSASGSKAGGADPAAFYASRLQAARAGNATPSPPPANAQPQGKPEDRNQQGPKLSAEPAAAAANAGSALAAAPPGAAFEPMAGRVLLLGRRTRRLDPVQEATQAWQRSSSGSGRQEPSTSLAAHPGVEGLSRLGSASIVAKLPVSQQKPAPARSSSNPLLWQAVFGARHSAPTSPAATSPASSRPGTADVIATPTGLPRIRTRPVGESREVAPAAAAHGRRAARGAGPVGEAAERDPPGASNTPRSGQQGLLRAGSLLLRTRTASGTPRSLALLAAASGSGSARGGPRHGPLTSQGSGPVQLQHHHHTPRSRYGSAAASGGPQMRSLEADREAIAAGRRLVVPSADGAGGAPQQLRWDGGGSGGSGGEVGARLCVRWLDELVVALWHDLSAYLEWQVLDQSLREARGMTHAELVIASHAARDGSGPPALPPANGGGSDASGPKPPPLTVIDWARRGFLAERLGHARDAGAAYRAAVTLGFSLSAYTGLLRMEAQAGAVADALMCAQQLLLWHEARAAAVLGGAAAVSWGGRGGQSLAVPTSVSWFLGETAARGGPDRVGRALAGDGDAAHPALTTELRAWERQRAADAAAGAA